LGHKELSSKLGGEPAVQLFRSFDKSVSIRGEELKELKTFVTSNGYPLVEELSGANFNRFVEAGLVTVVLFDDLEKKEQFAEHLTLLNKVAESLKGKASISYTNGVVYKEQLKAMGGDENKIPSFAAMDIQKRLNYPYDGEFTQAAVQKWVEGILSGDVKPHLKSQPIPEKQDGPVYVLVGKAFESVVYDKTKDVLVEFYAPWCGHCKSLAPIFDKLGELTKNAKNLIIAKIDATENDTPINIEGFPTLFFFPSDNKKGVTYESGRTLGSFVKYLKENAVASKSELADLHVDEKEEEKKRRHF